MANRMKISNIICSLFLVILVSQKAFGEDGKSEAVNINDLNSRASLSSLMCKYATSPVDMTHLDYWYSKIDNDGYLKTDSSVEGKIKIRDMAVFYLEIMASMNFLSNTKRTFQVAEILSCSANGELYRSPIGIYSDDEIKQIKREIDCWTKGYGKGLTDCRVNTEEKH